MVTGLRTLERQSRATQLRDTKAKPVLGAWVVGFWEDRNMLKGSSGYHASFLVFPQVEL